MIYGCGPGWHGEWMIPGMMLAWVVLILLAVYALVRWIKRMGPPNQPGSGHEAEPTEKNAIRLLEEAYARGEISRDEFFQKRDDILGKTSPS